MCTNLPGLPGWHSLHTPLSFDTDSTQGSGTSFGTWASPGPPVPAQLCGSAWPPAALCREPPLLPCSAERFPPPPRQGGLGGSLLLCALRFGPLTSLWIEGFWQILPRRLQSPDPAVKLSRHGAQHSIRQQPLPWDRLGASVLLPAGLGGESLSQTRHCSTSIPQTVRKAPGTHGRLRRGRSRCMPTTILMPHVTTPSPQIHLPRGATGKQGPTEAGVQSSSVASSPPPARPPGG